MTLPSFNDIIAWCYKLTGIIGKGTAALVYSAEHIKTGEAFAVKVLLPRWAADARHRERFSRGAAVHRQLTHMNIVDFADSGEHNGLQFVAMKLIDGASLARFVRMNSSLAVGELIELAAQITSAIDTIHARGFIHGDIKPENVIVKEDRSGQRRCFLIDFGLATCQRASAASNASEPIGSGTPLYMPPEQISGDVISPASDVYSLGCLFYEILCGEAPFESSASSTMELLSESLFSAPPSLKHRVPGLPNELVNLIHAMLAKTPSERPTAARVLSTLCSMLPTRIAPCFQLPGPSTTRRPELR